LLAEGVQAGEGPGVQCQKQQRKGTDAPAGSAACARGKLSHNVLPPTLLNSAAGGREGEMWKGRDCV